MRPSAPGERPIAAGLRWVRIGLLACLPLLGSALGHAHLGASQPAEGSVLEQAPSEVLLSFTERVEVGFSVVKLLRLDAEVDLSAATGRLRLAGLAAQAVNTWLGASEPSPDAVAFTLSPSAGAAAELSLALEEPLPPGHYVVMWRVLSVDTHITEGHFLFSVDEAP